MSEEASVERLMSADPEEEAKSQSDEGEEKEYEIEAILESRRNMFGRTRMGYKVKWKGYPEEDNSWVDERDAGGAEELIRDFWATSAAKQSKSQSNGTPNGKSPSRRGRPRGSGAASTSRSTSAKRALVANNSSDSEAEVEENGKAKRRRITEDGEDDDDDDEKTPFAMSMKELASKKSWEQSVQEIETVQRGVDGELTIYFRVKPTGTRVKETSKTCRARMPQKLFDFYECSIAWRTEEGELVDRHGTKGQIEE